MDVQLEEGELNDSSEDEEDINPYIPLERPVTQLEQQQPFNDETPAMEEDATSSNSKLQLLNSDSESDDDHLFTKRFKPSPAVKSKYNVWNKDPNGDLTDFLNQVDIKENTIDLKRDVENYPIPFISCNSTSNLSNKKRKVPNRNNGEKQNFMKLARNLEPLEVTASNTIEEVADEITKKLKEYNQELILKIVLVLGKDRAIELYEKTRVIEKMGGLPILNGTRKRTSGGVFIFLVRSDKDLSEDKLKAIFERDMPHSNKLRYVITKIKKKGKKKTLKKTKNKNLSSELSNPPPSPDLPDLAPNKTMLSELDEISSLAKNSEFSNNVDTDHEFISGEEMELPQVV